MSSLWDIVDAEPLESQAQRKEATQQDSGSRSDSDGNLGGPLVEVAQPLILISTTPPLPLTFSNFAIPFNSDDEYGESDYDDYQSSEGIEDTFYGVNFDAGVPRVDSIPQDLILSNIAGPASHHDRPLPHLPTTAGDSPPAYYPLSPAHSDTGDPDFAAAVINDMKDKKTIPKHELATDSHNLRFPNFNPSTQPISLQLTPDKNGSRINAEVLDPLIKESPLQDTLIVRLKYQKRTALNIKRILSLPAKPDIEMQSIPSYDTQSKALQVPFYSESYYNSSVPSTTSQHPSNQPLQHKRVWQACEPCRQLKVKCALRTVDNPIESPCVRCKRKGIECFFSATRRNLNDERKGTGTAWKGKSVEGTLFQNRGPMEFASLGGRRRREDPFSEARNVFIKKLRSASQQDVTRPGMLHYSPASKDTRAEMTRNDQSEITTVMDRDDGAKDQVPPGKDTTSIFQDISPSDSIGSSVAKSTPVDNMSAQVRSLANTTVRRPPQTVNYQPQPHSDLFQVDYREVPGLRNPRDELDNNLENVRGGEAVLSTTIVKASSGTKAATTNSVPRWSNPDPYTALPPPDMSQLKKRDVVRLIRIRRARVAAEAENNGKTEAADESPFNDEVENLRDLEDRQRMTRNSKEVSLWIDSLIQGKHEEVSMFNFEYPGDDNDISPIDDGDDKHENRLIDGQVYFKSKVLDTADIELSQLSRHWYDGPSHPYATTTSVQPISSNEAMMRWRRQADELSVVSRAATWGTRRRSEPSIFDFESEADGQILKRIGTTPSKESAVRETSPLTSVFSRSKDGTMLKRARSSWSMSATDVPASKLGKTSRNLFRASDMKSLAKDPFVNRATYSTDSFTDIKMTGSPGQGELAGPHSAIPKTTFEDQTIGKGNESDDSEPEISFENEPIIPNAKGFEAHVRRLYPDMGSRCSWLVARISQQQVLRYTTLLDLKVKHVQAVYDDGCNAADYCLEQTGTVHYPDMEEGNVVEGTSSKDADLAEQIYPNGIPAPPNEKFPAKFECQICFRVKEFRAPADWVKHVHEDVQLFTCTFENCKDSNPFKRKVDWIRHENERHRHLEWWICQVDDCRHPCYRKDNFLQHLVRQHKLPEPKQKSRSALKKTPLEPTRVLLDKCHHETTNRAQDEPCQFCGERFVTWKELTEHLARHMKCIALPVLEIVKKVGTEKDFWLPPIKQRMIPRFEQRLGPWSPNSLINPKNLNGALSDEIDKCPKDRHWDDKLQENTNEIQNRFEGQKDKRINLPSLPKLFSLLSPPKFDSVQENIQIPGEPLERPLTDQFSNYTLPQLNANTTKFYSERAIKSDADYSEALTLPPAYPIWPQNDNNFPIQNAISPFSFRVLPEIGDPCQWIRGCVLYVLADSQYLDVGIDWDLPSFVNDQYEGTPVAIDTIITLSGTALEAQASTCGAYVIKQWPRYGLNIISLLQKALDSASKTSSLTLDDIEISIKLGTRVVTSMNGDQSAIIEATQVLTWMGAALRTSSSSTVQYSELRLKEKYGEDGAMNGLDVAFETVALPHDEESCWYPLFVNPVIARGFPTTPRDNNEAGLEIPLEMMVALGGARYAVEFEGGLLLKGLSCMFIPTKHHQNSIQWHLIHHTTKTRLLYSEVKVHCPDRALLDEVNHDSLQDTRAFLGWWRTSKTNLGTDGYNYAATTYSSAMPSSNVTRASGGLNFSKILSSSQNMSIGAKDSRLFLSRVGPLEQIMEWAEMMPVLLYDVADRRGWFVRASDVMLHMIHTRHSKRPFRIEGKPVRLVGANQEICGDRAAEIAVMDMASVKLVQDDVNRANDYYVNDLVSDMWALLESLSEMQDASYTSPEDPEQEKLQGWEFMALVDRKSPIQRKEVNIGNSTGGWQHLIHDVNAIVLLANGFGDLIQPPLPSPGLCQRWMALPKNKDYMASAVPLLKRLCEEAGSASPYLHLTPSKLQWHRKSMLFDDCDGKGTMAGRCDCERLQQVVPQSTSEAGTIRPPGHLDDKGCVIFGLPEPILPSLLAVDPAPMMDVLHNDSNGKVDIETDHLDVTEIANPSLDDNPKTVSRPSPKLVVSLPILDGKSPEWESNGDYRCNGLYPKSRGRHEPSDLFFEQRAVDWSLRLPLDDSYNVKKAKKRGLNAHDDFLSDSKRVHVDESAISIAESKRIRLDEAASPICQTGRIWETIASRDTLPISIRDPRDNIEVRMIMESENQQYVVTLESPVGAEK